MTTSGIKPAIWCPVCGKNAFEVRYNPETGVSEYCHIDRWGKLVMCQAKEKPRP